MKEGIHPNYAEATITCACGNVFTTNTTKGDMKVDVCSKCHPFWTGNLKQNTTGGRADKFKKKYGIQYNINKRVAKAILFLVIYLKNKLLTLLNELNRII